MFVGLHDGAVRLIEKFEDLSLEGGGEVDQTGVDLAIHDTAHEFPGAYGGLNART